jgi:hypothetical protein
LRVDAVRYIQILSCEGVLSAHVCRVLVSQIAVRNIKYTIKGCIFLKDGFRNECSAGVTWAVSPADSSGARHAAVVHVQCRRGDAPKVMHRRRLLGLRDAMKPCAATPRPESMLLERAHRMFSGQLFDGQTTPAG